jgi:hypothetical protein
MPTVLVVANETIGGSNLLDAVRERAQADQSTRFRLVVPRTRPRSGLVIYDEAVRDAAQVRVDLARSYLAREGLQVEGDVGDPDPFTATLDEVAGGGIDEIIISTLPATSSGWLKRDLVERIRDASGLPVTHVVTDLAGEGLPFEVTLVVANRTANTDSLLARLKEKAAEHGGDNVFIVVVPLDSGEGNASAAARARLGNTLDRLRGEGLLAAGMIGDPDPYVATMNALQFYTVDTVIISTLPESRSGWLRQDLLARVRKASNIEIEHVVAERVPAANEAA